MTYKKPSLVNDLESLTFDLPITNTQHEQVILTMNSILGLKYMQSVTSLHGRGKGKEKGNVKVWILVTAMVYTSKRLNTVR